MPRRFIAPLILTVAASLLLTLHAPVPAQAAPGRPGNIAPRPTSTEQSSKFDPTDSTEALYIVQLAGTPLAAFGALPTRAGRPDLASPAAQTHAATLAQVRQTALRAIGRALGRAVAPVYTYDTAYHGVALRLTGPQAARIADLPGIVSIEREQIYTYDTDAGPTWIGADTIWDASTTGVYAATILGANEVPPVSSPASGRGTFSFTSGDSTLHYTIVVAGLTEAITGAHIHRGSPGNNGGVVVSLTPGATPGTYAGSTVLSASDVALLESDGLYVNIHTASNPGGEVRGNISGYKGEGVVVGILDSGINTTHPSFAAVGGDGYRHLNPLGAGSYRGACDPTNLPSVAQGNPMGYNPAITCNDKLIGTWTFTQTAVIPSPADEPSPNDDDGHGSHTASTVAGNVVENVSLSGASFPQISGVAPHANIIAYDVCGFLSNGVYSGNCPGGALVAAVDRATRDQVDVINYSISGGASPWTDAVEIGFRNARAAGIVVSVSAGNSGPTASTVGHLSPWLLSTAATTHNRKLVNRLTNIAAAGGATLPDFTGAGTSVALPTDTPLVYAGAAGIGNALCGPFNDAQAALVAGKIVVCDRGTYGRVEKAQNVQAAGGVGYVLLNNAASGNSLNADAYPIPGVHLTYNDGVTFKSWLAANTNPTARISGTVRDLSASNGDIMAAFSSRGPSNSPAAQVLKPDVAAPGVDIIAAVANDGSGGADYDLISGTSMASPHNAGAAALLVGLHPSWTPGQVQSALMTTATDAVRKEDGTTPATPFDTGAGRIRLERAALAGLVLDETAINFESADPALGGDPNTLNTPSMAEPACIASCSWTRTVKSTLDAPVTWTATGTDRITVTPSSFTIPAGGTQTITVSYNVDGLTLGTYVFGRVTLTSAGDIAPPAAFPVAARPTASDLPSALEFVAYSGVVSDDLPITSIAYSDLTTTIYGLTKGDSTTTSLEETELYTTSVTVPTDTARLVAEILESPSEDIDLYIYRDNGNGVDDGADTEVCASATGATLEYCNLLNPTAALYFIHVENFEASAPGASDLTELVVAVVPRTDVGNLTVTGPTSSGAGTNNFTFAVNEPSSSVGDAWYGWVGLADGATALGTATFNFYHVLGPPSTLDVTDGSPQTAPVGSNFATPLAVEVMDEAGNPVPGVPVTFSAPASGPSATFPASDTAVTNSSGVATVSVRANTVVGSYSVTASAQGADGPITASFSLSNTPGAAASVTASSGTPQSTPRGQPFAQPLVVTVKDQYGNAVPGATVTFSVPASGASAVLSSGTATTNAQGRASVTATANGTVGSYSVIATVAGATAGSFRLTNTAGAPASVTVSGGGTQSAGVGQSFAQPLLVTVKDAGGQPLAGVTVTFSAPTSGASATLSSGTATTNAQGQASVTARANTVAGSYTVTARVSGVSTPATFRLTNTASGTTFRLYLPVMRK